MSISNYVIGFAGPMRSLNTLKFFSQQEYIFQWDAYCPLVDCIPTPLNADPAPDADPPRMQGAPWMHNPLPGCRIPPLDADPPSSGQRCMLGSQLPSL